MTSGNDVDRIKDDEKSEHGDGCQPASRARRCLELCHCRRELLALKVYYFAFFGSFGVVIKYSSIFLKQHGLSAIEIGAIAGVRPLIGFVSAPVWGALADRYGIRRFLMIASLVAWLVFFTGLYMVREPVRRTECPESLQPFLQREALRKILDRDKRMFVNGSSSSGRSNSSLLGEEEQAVLREDLDWLYEPTSRYYVFIICLIIIVGGEFFQSPTTAMADAATLQILGRERLHQYGAQRAWGQVGWAIR